MKILAFDIATSTGVAFAYPGQGLTQEERMRQPDRYIPLTKVVDLGAGRSDARRVAKALRMAEGFIDARKPDFVAMECPIGPKASGILWMLYGAILAQVERMEIRHATYQVSSIRKHFLGKNITVRDYPGLTKDEARAEIKKVVKNRCRSLGWQVDTDDEADACALLDFALAKNGALTVPAGGLFNEQRSVGT